MDISAKVGEHQLRVIAGDIRLGHTGFSVCIETGEENCGFDLGGGHRRLIVDAVKQTTGDCKRGTAISIDASDVGTHQGQRIHDSFHRTLLDRGITGQGNIEILSGENAGDQAGGCAAVSAVEDVIRLCETMKSLSVNENAVSVILNLNAHCAEAGNCGETVCSLKKVGDFGLAFCDRTEHDAAVGDGFVSRNRDFTVKSV